MSSKKTQDTTGMMLVISFGVLFLVNSIILLAANALFPQYVVLGTLHITKTWAIIYSMGALAIINTFAVPFIKEYQNKSNKMLSDKEWMLIYLVINFVGVWGITRFADKLGFGIASWIIAVALAIVLDVVQGIAMMQLEKIRQSF